MSSNDAGSKDSDRLRSSGDDRSSQMEQGRITDSPLGQLDPSRITHMVVDQVGLGVTTSQQNERFVVPGPPHQQWIQSSPAASPSIMHSSRAMVDCGQQPRMSTPTNLMQQQSTIGSPSMNGTPMNPQNLIQQQHQGMIQGQRTPVGQYEQNQGFAQRQQQLTQGYAQEVPDSPGVMQMQHQHMVSPNTGQVDSTSAMYARQQQMIEQQQQQQLMSQQQQQQHMLNQQQMTQQQMGMMTGNQQQYYAQQNPQAQWTQQQQMQYIRQQQALGAAPGQRVMVQRVPYPPGAGYPPGMQAAQQQQQVQSVGQAGSRPSSAIQQQPQRPVYPPGSAPQQPQYAYPGAQTNGFQQQQAAQAAAYQQQMYQRQQQIPQHMRPYMSPQGTVMTPTQQAVYTAGAQPHTPQTPQPPYTPNGSRFPQPTPSPQYAPDMRSPSLMSPTQVPMTPQAAMPRPMSNGEMVAQPIRVVPTPQQPVMPSQFFTYEPNVLMSVRPEICLAGCVLHMFDMEKMFTDKMDLPNMVLAVRMHGGDIEFGAKAYSERVGVITHVIVESIRTQHAHLALKDRKRLVTMQWLVDVLIKKQMDVPWRHAHLPSVFVDGCRPLLGKLVSFSGFDEGERAAMKYMVEAMGAKFTPYLSRSNDLLIAKSAGIEKVTKAQEWDIPVVNYQWLADSYAGQRVEIDNPRYQVGQPCEGVSPGPYALEMVNDQFKQLLLAWKMPIIVSPEQWRRSFDTKQAVENDEGVFPNKKLRAQSAPPSEEEIAAKAEERKKAGGKHPEYVVAFCGIDEENKHVLTQKLRYLGGRACEEISECTHLVTTNGRRTERLLEAICLGRNIVNPYWIVHGYECRQWMDTLDYFLHDEDQERNLGYNCKRSVLRARHRKLFEDVQFYITPSVEPSRAVLSKLIRLAGGIVHDDRPAPAEIARCIETDAPYIVISCECDLRMVQYLLECNFPVYNTDLVLIALIRQELQPHPLYRVNTASLMPPKTPVQQQAHRVKA
ncbi:unnamed protein product [Cylicocyclus nassatus]|uniref:PAX-interacting protein 1 n=1 Tax=Cylicocyclus nassatus TaxID=53992 RepID=A0AA36H9Q4_CYLNA|nr:unnamed protein product [Cylicocyclus nassatus]